jgi:hypothetical protein
VLESRRPETRVDNEVNKPAGLQRSLRQSPFNANMRSDMILSRMKLWEKIFTFCSVVWIFVIYFFYYTGLVKGVLSFRPDLIDRIRGLFN